MFCTIYAVDITVPDCRSGRGQQKNASLSCAFGCTANLAGGLSSFLGVNECAASHIEVGVGAQLAFRDQASHCAGVLASARPN